MYHHGSAPEISTPRTRKYRQIRTEDLKDRPIIAWDGEGMNLSGRRHPQHYVLFGCSAEIGNPLLVNTEKDSLDFYQLADYACSVAERNPGAFHVGYFFEYDQNMIIRSLSWRQKQRLYETGMAYAKKDDVKYFIKMVPGKKLSITRRNGDHKSTFKVEDLGSFFATSFINAYSSLFPKEVNTDAFASIVAGKASRGDNKWEDFPDVISYWRNEILAVHDLAQRFRDIMYKAGFFLTEWYGPGALANYVRRTKKLVIHEWGGKEENIPAEVHHAAKSAYFGGHVESFFVGRVEGPVSVWDINSAYPYAFTSIPTLQKGGFWQHVDTFNIRNRGRQPFGVYRIRWQNRAAGLFEHRPQPFPHRDRDGNITYPPICEGWYWTPEAYTILRRPQFRNRAECIEGWEWIPVSDDYPWADVVHGMYHERQLIRSADPTDPSQMAFKLGPNSLYGKTAQRAGWDKEKRLPPRAHTLSMAGYITSFCRAQIFSVLPHLGNHQLIAIETDGLFTTAPVDSLPMKLGKELGDWSVTTYDELLFIQNGLYLGRQGSKWKLKSRGVSKESLSPELVSEYFSRLTASDEWPALELGKQDRFIGLGSSIARSRTERGMINPYKAAVLHCQWQEQTREIVPGGKGKRIHAPHICPACRRGATALDEPHQLIIRSRALEAPISAPYRLPWEGQEDFSWRKTEEAETPITPDMV